MDELERVEWEKEDLREVVMLLVDRRRDKSENGF